MQQSWELAGPWMQQPWTVLHKGVTGVKGVIEKEKEMASIIMESFFQRSLEDLIKGLRVQLIGEACYVGKALEDIRKEIKSTDVHTKAVALQKLTYLNMLRGVDMEWASFHVVEVMSSPRFAYKKIGYQAASQSFDESTDVLLLITNQLRKDLTSTNEYEAGLALDCLSRIATTDLARDLTPEIFTMLNSSRLYIRKKATLVFLKFFSKYPDGVRIAFKRLVEKMEDPEPQVVCAAVSVLCEIAVKDPKAYLPLAPEFYRLLVDSTNNWILIKVVKLFGVLAPVEPRLGRKIAEPLCEHMMRTGAKSFLLECIRTVVIGLTDHMGAVKLAAAKLKELLAEADPNLRYLALNALATLMLHHPWVVADNKEVIIRSLSDGDLSIQMASLRLIVGTVSDNNIIEIMQILMQYAQKSNPEFSNELIGAILATCSKNLYEFITDFCWYVSMLGEIARIPHCSHGKEVERQFIDIGIRVKDARADLVGVARSLLLDPTLLGHSSLYDVLSAAAWIVGEYVEFFQNAYEVIEALLQPRTKLLPPSVRAIYLQAILKVFVFFAFELLQKTHNLGKASSPKNLLDSLAGLSLMEETNSLYPTKLDVASCSNDRSEGGLLKPQSEMSLSAREACSPFRMDEVQENATTRNAGYPKIVTQLQGEKLDEHVFQLMNLIIVNVSPLAQNIDVEVQERASNLLGFLKCLNRELISRDIELDGSSGSKPSKFESATAFEMVNFMREVFSQELGPVSIYSQGRIPVPDGLSIEEARESLESFLSDEETVPEKEQELTLWKPQATEWEDGPVFVQRDKEDTSQSGESISLLALHRQRHNAYYLSTENASPKADEYPPLHIPNLETASTSEGALNDAISLTEQSLFLTKPRRSKPRPVVIRLDDTEEMPVLPVKSYKDLKDNFVSSAIREVLGVDKDKSPLHVKNKPPFDVKGSEDKQSMLHSSSHHKHKRHHSSRLPHAEVMKEKAGRMQVDSGGSCANARSMLVATSQIAEAGLVKHEKKRRQKQLRHKKDDDVHKRGWLEVDLSSRQICQQSQQQSKHRTRSPVQISSQEHVIHDFLL